MFYHLIGEKPVFFIEDSIMENVLGKASVTESMFTVWQEALHLVSLLQSLYMTRKVDDGNQGRKVIPSDG